MAKKNAKKPAKKAAVKKVVKKAQTKKPVNKVVKKAVVKKPVKKVTPLKKVVKKVVAKKTIKKVVAKKANIKKPLKKVIVKKVADKKTAVKNINTSKKVSAPNATTKKVIESKVIAKHTTTQKPVKKVVQLFAKKAEKKVAAKPAPKPANVDKSNKAIEPKTTVKPVVAASKKPEVVTKHVTLTIDKTSEERKPTPAKDIHFPDSKEEQKIEIIESKRYSDNDLVEFKEIINKKLTVAREELANLIEQMQNPGMNAAADTDNAYKTLEDGASTAEKEYVSQLAARQRKFIENLENALVRIENKTYGICRVTGKLISKDRLRAVPHTTLSMEAKMQQYK